MSTRRMWQLAVLAMGLGGFAAGPLLGSPIGFNFGGSDTALSAVQAYTAGGLTITAYGYKGSSSNDLYQKDNSGSEDGLGLSGTTNNEINPNQAIIIDVSDLVSHGITGGTFSLGSLQNHSATDVESGDACIISSKSPIYSPGTGCANGLTGVGSSGVGSVTLSWGSSDFVEFITNPNQTDPSGNYLVNTLTIDTTPEPPSVILFGSMLLGLVLVGRRRWPVLLG